MSLLDSFLIRAALAGIGVALAAAPLGCFVVWRRMAYFGDATAHASILGVAIALALDVPVFAGALVMALIMSTVVASLSGRGHAAETRLGVAAQSSLAISSYSSSDSLPDSWAGEARGRRASARAKNATIEE